MNATQVLMLYLKQQKKAHLMPRILKHINKRYSATSTFSEQKEMGYDIITNFLAIRGRRLFDLAQSFHEIITLRNCKDAHEHFIMTRIFSDWGDFLRANLNGNYFKYFVAYDEPEIQPVGLWRNGYHNIDFSLKTKKWEE